MSTCTDALTGPGTPTRMSAAVRSAAAGAAGTVRTWRERARHRRCLMQLDAHILQDIGLTGRDQLRETEKPFWCR